MEETEEHAVEIRSKVTPKKRKHDEIALFDEKIQNKIENFQNKKLAETIQGKLESCT